MATNNPTIPASAVKPLDTQNPPVLKSAAMGGYTPVFNSVFQGSLCGHYPDTAAWLFFLALADKNGCVDSSPHYISAITGMPVDDLLGCIERFCEPDPHSRTTDNDGRRLELIDLERPWGWRILNHGKYREKARKASYDAARVADGRNAERMAERRRPDATRADPPSDTNTNADTNSNKEEEGRPRKRGTRLPDDWQPGEAEVRYARDHGLDPGRVAEKFKNHWRSAAGKGAVKLDWSATWRNWCLRDAEDAPCKPADKPVPTTAQVQAERAKAAGQNRAVAERLGLPKLRAP